jgi:hypothetical protein
MWTHVPFDAPPCIEAEWRHAALSVGALDDVIHVAQRLAPRWHPAADVPLLLSLLLLLLLLCGWRWRRARAHLWWRHGGGGGWRWRARCANLCRSRPRRLVATTQFHQNYY